MRIPGKNTIKDFLPPVLLRYYNRRCKKYRFHGNYKTWAQAKSESVGYEAAVILERTKEALLKVKNSQAIHERDSVLFNTIEYSYPVSAALMWVAANNSGILSVIDYGGSLGSHYFQNRYFLDTLKEVSWNVVEQKHFVECGKSYFEDGRLRFYESIEECQKVQDPKVILLSGVIQFIQYPYELLKDIVNNNFEYMIFDRTSFNRQKGDRLVVQKVSPQIYEASYPCWFLDIKKFTGIIENKYKLISDFIGYDDTGNLDDPTFKGFIYKKR